MLATAFLALSLSQSPPVEAPADFRVVIYYNRADPRTTFRSQAYDLRRGEYNQAVDDWLAHIRGDYPHYRAYRIDVTLGDWPGSVPAERLAAAIESERLGVILTYLRAQAGTATAGRRSVPSGYSPIEFSFGSESTPLDLRDLTIGLPTYYQRGFGPPLGASNAIPSAWSAPFPVPMPYPRPHP